MIADVAETLPVLGKFSISTPSEDPATCTIMLSKVLVNVRLAREELIVNFTRGPPDSPEKLCREIKKNYPKDFTISCYFHDISNCFWYSGTVYMYMHVHVHCTCIYM